MPGVGACACADDRRRSVAASAAELVADHAAENAVAEATPILKEALKRMTEADARTVLTGGDGADRIECGRRRRPRGGDHRARGPAIGDIRRDRGLEGARIAERRK